jgi:uncharacterized membrane protein
MARRKNPAAVALGKLALGVPKNFSAEERQRRSEAMTELNRIRYANGKIKGNSHQRSVAKRKAKAK